MGATWAVTVMRVSGHAHEGGQEDEEVLHVGADLLVMVRWGVRVVRSRCVQAMGWCTVTSLVPSGKVASTWMSGIISATPSITSARVSTVLPSLIN